MKNAFIIVTLSGLLSSCAVAPPPAPVPAQPPATMPEAAAETIAAERLGGDDGAAEAADLKLPHVKLTSNMLYQIMKAELDFRNGNWQGPYLTMMSLAQQTRDPRLARRAAEMALASRQADDSLAAIRLWRELAPDSEEAVQYYLGLVVLTDKLAEAEPLFKRRLADAAPPTRGIAMFQIQQLLLRAKDKAAASAMLERLVAPYASMMEAHVVLAQGAFARGAKADALREARAAVALRPDSEIAMLTLAQVTEDEARITDLLAKFLTTNPGASEVRSAYARVLVSRKQYEKARQEFMILLKAQPDNATTLYALGILSMQLNQAAVAETYFTRFVDVVGNSADDERDPSKVLLILSQLAEDRGDFKRALEWLDKVSADDTKVQFSAQLRRAQLTGRQGDLAAARRLLGTLKPDDPADQAQLVAVDAQLLRDAGKVEEAYTVMEAGTRRFPTNADLLYDFALLAEKTGRVDVMEQALRKVITQSPENHHAYNALGYSLAERNVRLQEARELIAKALNMAPADPFIMDSMGWVLYRLGNLGEAEAQLRRAYALRSDPEIAVHLGEVLWQRGQKEEAQKLWRAARAKDPKNDSLRNTLARLRLSL